MKIKEFTNLFKEKIMFSRRLYWLLAPDKFATYLLLCFGFLISIFFQEYYVVQKEMTSELFGLIIILIVIFFLLTLLAIKSNDSNYNKFFLTCKEETIEFMDIFNNSIKESLSEKSSNISSFINAFENGNMTFALAKCEKYYRKGKIDEKLLQKTKDFYVKYFLYLHRKEEERLLRHEKNQSNLQNKRIELSNILKVK